GDLLNVLLDTAMHHTVIATIRTDHGLATASFLKVHASPGPPPAKRLSPHLRWNLSTCLWRKPPDKLTGLALDFRNSAFTFPFSYTQITRPPSHLHAISSSPIAPDILTFCITLSETASLTRRFL